MPSLSSSSSDAATHKAIQALSQKEEVQRAAVYAAYKEALNQGFDPAIEAPAVVAAMAAHTATDGELRVRLAEWVASIPAN